MEGGTSRPWFTDEANLQENVVVQTAFQHLITSDARNYCSIHLQNYEWKMRSRLKDVDEV